MHALVCMPVHHTILWYFGTHLFVPQKYLQVERCCVLLTTGGQKVTTPGAFGPVSVLQKGLSLLVRRGSSFCKLWGERDGNTPACTSQPSVVRRRDSCLFSIPDGCCLALPDAHGAEYISMWQNQHNRPQKPSLSMEEASGDGGH